MYGEKERSGWRRKKCMAQLKSRPERCSLYFFMTKSISFLGSRRPVELPMWPVELGNEFAPCLSRYFSDSLRKFWTDVSAAAMAGLPKPCVMRLKCVRLRWMPESSTGCTRLLHSGDRSCPSSSTNSFSTCLQRKWQREKEESVRSELRMRCTEASKTATC